MPRIPAARELSRAYSAASSAKNTGSLYQRLGWKDRGVLREGAYADLVLLDPLTVIDRATFTKPQELPTGIEKVFVNGVLVWNDAKPTGATPGQVLAR